MQEWKQHNQVAIVEQTKVNQFANHIYGKVYIAKCGCASGEDLAGPAAATVCECLVRRCLAAN